MADLFPTCELCKRLGLEVTRLLGVTDQLQRQISTLQIERPLTIEMQAERRRVAELELALREVEAMLNGTEHDGATAGRCDKIRAHARGALSKAARRG